MTRSPNLSKERVEAILAILKGWTGRVTWQRLIDQIEQKLLCRYTRQALDGHDDIAEAFRLAKDRVQGQTGRPPVEDPVLQKALERIAGLEAEIEQISSENERLISKFIRWAHNAHLRGMTEGQLEQPLPPIGGRRGRNARDHASNR